jgi:hypothetical protein
VLVIAFVAALSTPLPARWAKHPTPGVPRLPDGKPNLTAPAPRTADGKPDLSGNCEVPGGFGRNDRPPAPPAGTPPLAYFWNTGAGFPDDLPFQPWARELKKQRMATESKDNPDALCLPMGFMQFHTHPQPWKMVQTRDVLVISYEANYGLHRSTSTAVRALITTSSRGGLAIREGGGTETRWSWKRRTSSMASGWM